MSSANSSLDSTHSAGDSLSRSYSMSTADRLRESVPTPRDYDGLKSQCDKAMHELQLLRRQHSETVRRCEHTMKELEYYRGESHKPSIDSTDLRFTSDLNDLRPPDGENSSGDAVNQLYLSTVSKYEAIKDDYESLRKRYDDLITSHSSAVDKLELAQEEVGRLKKQCDEMVGERNVAVRERNGLKQQCTAAIRQWDIALREKNEYQEALIKVQQQHEEAVKEINQAMAVRMKASKDLKRLTEERNAAMHEYSLIMSERETVHKEMEKLTEDLTQAFKKIKAFESDNKQLADDKKALLYQVETLKREVASALHDRDKALKECTDLRGKFGPEKDDGQRDNHKRYSDYKYRERDSGSKDLGESHSSSMDLYDKCHKEKVDDIDQANQEIDRLLKHNDKLQTELQESLQEAEVCKRRRDWAFSERDKIVQERESIRTLCDRLRKERDRAVSDLAEALRDSDDIKKQRNETSKQLKVLKERMEAQLEKESRMVQLQSTTHNYSHDSAIDTDMHEWDSDTLTIQLAGPETEDLGLELAGGRDDPILQNDCGVYVALVSKGSIGYGKLKPNDCIMRINNVDCTNMSKRYVLETLRSCGSTVILVVRRRRICTTQLQLNNFEHGLNLESGIYINKICSNSLAAKEGNLSVGDRVLSINSRSVEGMTTKEAQGLLKESGEVLLLSTVKSSGGGIVSTGGGASYSVRQANASTQTLVTEAPPLVPPAPVYRPNPVVNLPSESSVSGSAWSRQRQVLVEEKKRNRNSSPITFEQERDDAIAELDSVIDSYHQRTATVRKRTKDKNNGTWPKARGVAVVENGTGTIVERKTKERLPLTGLLNNPPNYSLPRCCDVQPRHSNPLPVDFTVKPGGMDYYEKKKGRVVSQVTEESHIHSQLYGSPHGYPFAPFGHRHSHTHSPPPLHAPPDTRFCFEPPYNTLSQYHHGHSPSVDSSHYHKARSLVSPHPHHDDSDHPVVYHYETGTFPRKRENQRFRIPSNPSVTSKGSGGKMSTSSIEKSERGSPMPQFHVEVLSPGHHIPKQAKASSLPDYCWPQKPLPGELRRVHIDKSCEPLGIQISCLDSGGVFVSTVNDQSLAAQVGLQVGDQLLEVCGINMRSATYKLAANVLRQCGNSITMLVQYSPDKYHEMEGSGSSSGGSKTRSGSPTPCNSPPRAGSPSHPQHHHHAAQLAKAVSSLVQQQKHHRSTTPRCSEEPRYLSIETHKCSNLGISLVGGNKVGIFVHSVQNNSLAYNAGLRTGDRILEFNGTDLRQATAEEAAYELAKHADKVTVLVQFCIERYQEVRDKPGDSLYMRALFDRLGEQGDALQLRFRKDDILYVDNTMFNGVPGSWRAWLLDDDGAKHTCGIIPSKYKVEEEMVLRRSLGDLESDGRRGTRRSFFRRKKHQRTDSKELASFSNMALGWYSDSGSLHDDSPLASYQRVSRLENPVFRPVLVVGPLAELVTEKLLQDFPDKFVKCLPEVMHCSQATMEKGVSDNLFVDYRKKGTYFEVTSISSVKDMSDKNAHCVLDVGLVSVERLLRHHIYPIVLLIKFKSTKQIKEIKDTRYALDKVTAKAAKEMYEHALKLESEYRHYISAIIPAGVNIAYMCTQVKAAVDLEQNKTLWVPYQ